MLSTRLACARVGVIAFAPRLTLKTAATATNSKTHREMSSNPSQTSSKPVNISNQSNSATYHFSPSVDAGFRRRPGGSGSFGAGPSSRNSNTPRNNQSKKNQHRRQARPRLLDDDEYSEAVGVWEAYKPLGTCVDDLTGNIYTGRHEINH